MKRVLIIGGNRFVGKQLSEVLVDKYRVDVFNRSGTSSDDRISVIQGDRNNKQDIDKIDFDKYDYIVDMCLFFPNQLELIIDSIKSKYIFVSSAAANNRYIDYYGDYILFYLLYTKSFHYILPFDGIAPPGTVYYSESKI